MYPLVLLLHSWLRWAAIAAGVAATGASFAAPSISGSPAPADRWGRIFVIVMDAQLLLGLLLYFFLSSSTRATFTDFGGAMADPVARFFAVEHITVMIFAVAMAHVGKVLASKATSAAQARTRRLVCYGLATVAMLGATPWPGMASGRPLFRV